MLWKYLLVTAVLGALAAQAVEGKRMLLRPIPASQVRQILKAAGREDALPEGRVITHGLAALHGFTLGLKKGIIGVALADSLAAMNWTDTSANTTTVDSKPSFSFNGTSDQLCFTSRSSTSDIVASGEAEGRATSTSATPPTSPTAVPPTSPTPTSPTPTSPTPTSPTPTPTLPTSSPPTSPTVTLPTATSPTGTSPTTTSPTGTSPPGTAPPTTPPTSSPTSSSPGTGTATSTTTSAGSGSVNCIVFQKV